MKNVNLGEITIRKREDYGEKCYYITKTKSVDSLVSLYEPCYLNRDLNFSMTCTSLWYTKEEAISYATQYLFAKVLSKLD